MDKNGIEKVCKKIYQRFPPLKGVHPKVSKQSGDNYLLVFSSAGTTPDGKTIQNTVRVVASAEGRIIKTSMSR
jgi:hypothetical protein